MCRRITLGLAATALIFSVVACGDDDESTSDTTASAAATLTDAATDTSAAPETSAPTDATASAATDVDAFCQAELAAEAAAANEDPAVMGPAFDALSAAAPADIKEVVDTVIATAPDESPEFEAAYGEMIQYVKANCGFTDIAVAATEYSFAGLPPEVPAGPAVVTFDNDGEEVHEIVVLRVNDGVTETVDELLALPEEESMTKVTFKGVAFAFPGTTAYTALDLEAGRYIATCFLPEGATPEVMEEMMAETEGSGPPDGGPEAPPHAMLGMIQEFQVT